MASFFLPLCLSVSPHQIRVRADIFTDPSMYEHMQSVAFIVFAAPVPDVRRICIFCTVPTVRPIVSNRPPNCSTSSISSHFCITMKIRTVSTGMFEKFAFFPPPFSKNFDYTSYPQSFNKIMITVFVSRPSRIRIELSFFKWTKNRERGTIYGENQVSV